MPGKEDEDDINWGDEPVQSKDLTPISGTAIDLDEPEYEGAKIPIAFKWSEARIDPVDYKPYSPLLIPQDIYIIVEVPEKLVISYQTDSEGIAIVATLNLEGYSYVQHKLALAIKKAFVK